MHSFSKICSFLLLFFLFFANNTTLFSQNIVHSPKSNFEDVKLELTSEEQEFLTSHPIIHVVCDPSWPPFEYYNTSLDVPQYSGLNIFFLRKIGEKLNVEMDFIPTEDYFKSIQSINDETADMITGYTSRLNGVPNLLYTESLYSIPLILVSLGNNKLHSGETIILPQISGAELDQLYEQFSPTQYNYVFFDDPQKVLGALKSGKYHFAVINEFELDDFSGLPQYSIFNLDINYIQTFAISPKLGSEGLSVINKAIKSISSEEFDSIVYTSQAERRYMLQEQRSVKINRRYSFLYSLIFTLILLTIVILVIIFEIKKRSNLVDYDEVTHILTFAKFKHDVRSVLKKAKPNEYLFLSLDIDNFSYINDSYRFVKGDALLAALSQHFLEECNKNDELLSRFYADNFIICSKNPGYFGIIEDRVMKLTDVSDHVRAHLPRQYNLTFSVGVYYVIDPHADITSMIDKANIARKLGKTSFSSRHVIEYTKEMDDASELKKNITFSMNNAISNGEFEVYFQPKFQFSNLLIVGAEALIRWNKPNMGLLPPSKFIPLFERNGFIGKIDFFVFEEVCRFLDKWDKSGVDGKCPHPITISFNLSRFHLYNPELIDELTSIASRYQINPSHIEVELTETIMFDNPQKLIRTMNDLKNAGFSISVDDFGSGYSSLNLLKDMPADVLKLDKEFLSTATGNERESIIITSVIKMAKQLNLTTVAEGVETQQQSDLLKKMGCDIVQGIYYAKPMPKNQYQLLLKNSFL